MLNLNNINISSHRESARDEIDEIKSYIFQLYIELDYRLEELQKQIEELQKQIEELKKNEEG